MQSYYFAIPTVSRGHVVVGTTSNPLVEPVTRHASLPVLQLYENSFILIPSALVLLPCRFLNPTGIFVGFVLTMYILVFFVWARQDRAAIIYFKRENPGALIFVIMFASYILATMLRSFVVFMSAITLPLACTFNKIMFENFMGRGR